MDVNSKDSLVWLKSMARAQPLPLDATEVFSSVEEARTYASTSAIAYVGQTVKALGSDGKYHTYTLQPSDTGFTLEEVASATVNNCMSGSIDNDGNVVIMLNDQLWLD